MVVQVLGASLLGKDAVEEQFVAVAIGEIGRLLALVELLLLMLLFSLFDDNDAAGSC